MAWARRLSIGIGACALTLAAPATAQELVTNGDFETGDLTGWTATGDVMASTFSPYQGAYDAAFGGPCCGSTLSQTIATTAGQQYTFSFYYSTLASSSNGIQAYFDGAQVYSDSNIQQGTPASLTVSASTASTVISFVGYHDFDHVYLDNVSVMAATSPEPGSWALLTMGFGAAGMVLRRRTKAATAYPVTA